MACEVELGPSRVGRPFWGSLGGRNVVDTSTDLGAVLASLERGECDQLTWCALADALEESGRLGAAAAVRLGVLRGEEPDRGGLAWNLGASLFLGEEVLAGPFAPWWLALVAWIAAQGESFSLANDASAITARVAVCSSQVAHPWERDERGLIVRGQGGYYLSWRDRQGAWPGGLSYWGGGRVTAGGGPYVAVISRGSRVRRVAFFVHPCDPIWEA
jgi:hypothetical protein